MIAALLLAAMSRQGSVRTVDLSHGASILPADSSSLPFGYWDTTDTYIDGTAPENNFGGEPILAVGPSKVLLIRFGDLNRVLGSTRHVRKATLTFTIAGGDAPVFASADRLIVPWNAGPYFTLGALLKRASDQATDQPKPLQEKPVPPRWSATWRQRFAGEGGASWQQGGANGSQDSETIKGAKGTVGEKEVAIEGLAAAVQDMADHPTANYGFGLRFQSGCEFYSSRAAIGRPRLTLELDSEPTRTGSDLSVVSIERQSQNPSAPKEGEDVTYVAHVKNVGGSKSMGFSAQWILNGKSGSTLELPDAVEPGAEKTVSIHKPYHLDKTDHRIQTVELRIVPQGPDSVTGNNALLVYDNAKQIDVRIPKSVAGKNAANLIGSTSVEDWVQEQVRVFNDTYAAQSRFSFAPDGARERVSVRHIEWTDDMPANGTPGVGLASVPGTENFWQGSDLKFLQSIGLAIGLPDFKTMSIADSSRIQLKANGKPVDRATSDLYPGVIGYGDTRNECNLAGPIGLLYEPFKAVGAGLLPVVPTGLLSETDVAVLNAGVDHLEEPYAVPKTTLIKATDLVGHPLSNAQLEFFQSKDGQIADGPPAFSVTTSGTEGTAILPSRGAHGPFGKISQDGKNGTFLIRATANGSSEWGWLKAWQLIDLASRGNTLAGVIEVRFDLPSAPLDASIDLAKDRIITDSTNLLPAKLGALVSGGADKDVTLGSKPGDWVEIDLGRDRTIGEITLLGVKDAFWPKFDILVYGTGQNLTEAAPWATEQDWNWAASNRRDLVEGNPAVVSVAYRSLAVRIRFIRIVNRSSFTGTLRGIRVVPVKIAP